MNQIVEYSDGSVITKEACAWIAQLDGDQPPSTQDLAALREWMNRSPAHRAEFKRLAGLWGDLNVLTELAGARTAPATVAPERAGMLRGWRPATATLSVLCGLLLAIVGVVLWNYAPNSSAALAYRTTIGEQLQQRLPDGSMLMLNTDSSVRLAFSKTDRAVWLLHGEAHFDVAHDRDRPFVVYAGNGVVRAVGTSFSVRVQDREVEVVVTEGTVELAAASAAGSAGDAPASGTARVSKLAMLEAGHAASFSDHVESLISVPADELARRVSWQQGMLVFSGDRLDTVVREVSRYTTRPIEFADPAVRELRVGGQFRVDDIDALFDALAMSFGVEVERDGERIVLSAPAERPNI